MARSIRRAPISPPPPPPGICRAFVFCFQNCGKCPTVGPAYAYKCLFVCLFVFKQMINTGQGWSSSQSSRPFSVSLALMKYSVKESTRSKEPNQFKARELLSLDNFMAAGWPSRAFAPTHRQDISAKKGDCKVNYKVKIF